MGLGVVVSIIFKATPLTLLKRSHANRITAQVLDAIADDGDVRRCKRAVRRAIVYIAIISYTAVESASLLDYG